jgi:protein TonB
MRLVAFFVLSLALHAAALAYPVSFGGRDQMELIQVTILPIEQGSVGTSDADAGGSGAPPASSKPAMRASATVRSSGQSKRVASVLPPTAPRRSNAPEPPSLPVEASAEHRDSGVALALAIVNSGLAQDAASAGSLGQSASGNGASSKENGGSGLGSSNTGFKNGSGQGIVKNGIVMTQARYRDTPRPDYPESARREGHEGRVLLRVLVDDHGRIKSVEISNSSGSAALDRAAAEAIRRWRFHPALYGDQPVESWLRIPIEFRLADAKS